MGQNRRYKDDCLSTFKRWINARCSEWAASRKYDIGNNPKYSEVSSYTAAMDAFDELYSIIFESSSDDGKDVYKSPYPYWVVGSNDWPTYVDKDMKPIGTIKESRWSTGHLQGYIPFIYHDDGKFLVKQAKEMQKDIESAKKIIEDSWWSGIHTCYEGHCNKKD